MMLAKSLFFKKKPNFTPGVIFPMPSDCLLEWSGMVEKRRKRAITGEMRTLSDLLASQCPTVAIFRNLDFGGTFIPLYLKITVVCEGCEV